MRFEQLKAFKKEHGHFRVTRGQGKDNATNQLAVWLSRQRAQYKRLQLGKKSTIKEESIQKLTEIGLMWGTIVTVDWDERFEELRAFEKKQGHCRVPQAKKGADTYQLALWVKLQRKGYKLFQQGKKSTMSQGRIQRLNGVGFTWFIVPEPVSWDARLEELKTFQLIHGHCRVPRSRSKGANYELCNWVTYQRMQYIQVRLGKKPQIWVNRIQK